MLFECLYKRKNKIEKWPAKVTALKNYGTHYEIRIQSRSGILVLFGRTSQGAFACMPDFGSGCHLANPKDIFWNTEKLVEVLGKVDGITVATVLFELSDKIDF